ncbi:unnamed protein product [Amaranthus hypochondriacus]
MNAFNLMRQRVRPAEAPSLLRLHQKLRLPPSKPHLASSPVSFPPVLSPSPRNRRVVGVAVAGIVLAVVVALIVLVVFLFKKWRSRRNEDMPKEISLGSSTGLLDRL